MLTQELIPSFVALTPNSIGNPEPGHWCLMTPERNIYAVFLGSQLVSKDSSGNHILKKSHQSMLIMSALTPAYYTWLIILSLLSLSFTPITSLLLNLCDAANVLNLKPLHLLSCIPMCNSLWLHSLGRIDYPSSHLTTHYHQRSCSTRSLLSWKNFGWVPGYNFPAKA